MEELKELKSVLRSLVVSSPVQVDVRSLMRDYRLMRGEPLPITKYGYRDPILFLRERFADCFLFQGQPSNPVLTLIVPDSLKHIDKFVQSQKVSSTSKFKGKRTSVPGKILNAPPPRPMADLDRIRVNKDIHKSHTEIVKPGPSKPVHNNHFSTNLDKKSENKENHSSSDCTRVNLENFLRRKSAVYSSQRLADEDSCKDDHSNKLTSDSGRHTASSSSGGSKRKQLEELRQEVKQLVLDSAEGVWCTHLMQLYREKYDRELNFSRHGYTSVVSFACTLEPEVVVSAPSDSGDCLVRDARRPPARAPPPRRRLSVERAPPRVAFDPDDALPGIDFDPGVFPADCMHFLDSIAPLPLEGLEPGAMVEVMVGEVYSPSHLWLIRLGDRYNIAMEDMMDEMTKYYNHGEGKDRLLPVGAVRVGHYCSSVYENDWHRSLIVKVIDSDTVKVRHVDYGTVERVEARSLRHLRREWAALPAQAVRARLAALRPAAAGRRWPRPAAAALLRLVRDKRLVASVVARDTSEDIVEVFLIDTSTPTDVCISAELIHAGHADPRTDSALGTSECYLYPRFEALESGATPNYAEIHAYLRDGIHIEFVDDYRRHVPSCLPPHPSAQCSPPPPPPPQDTSQSSHEACAPSPPPSPPPEDTQHQPSETSHRSHESHVSPTQKSKVYISTAPSSSTSPSPPPPPPPPPGPLTMEIVNRVPFFLNSKQSLNSTPESTSDELIETVERAPSPPAPRPPPPPAAPRRPLRLSRPPRRAPSLMMPPFILPFSAQSMCFPSYASYGPAPPQFYPQPPPPYAPPRACPPAAACYPPAPASVPPNYPPTSAPHPRLSACSVSYSSPSPTGTADYLNLGTGASEPVRHEYGRYSSASEMAGSRTPPPPYSGAGAGAGEARRVSTAHGEVTLTVSECEIFRLLSRVDANAAHWYMVDAIGRRMGTATTRAAAAPRPAYTLNPDAAEFRHAAVQTQGDAAPPPPPPPRVSAGHFLDNYCHTPEPPPGFH